ncbi:uncharacterized protein LOC116427017 isoform X2 [Nomia melanderi]|uniref:uncharacterized protein LOC116427017 isoform X2 n=1 Tax=Nomia melanderi TaxID=2448451 RepID=UPI0013045B0F|nr:uncharacterized protein LOC116427017 isoform X2 [Nomia melanderi]
MPSKNDPFGEDTSLLYPKHHGLPENFEAPIIRGVANQLRKWPTDLFYAFLAVCLVIGSLVLLVFVTVIVCLPTVVGNRVEDDRIIETNASSNVYFFKLENRNWSTREFCYIETAARRNPDLNVYLIALLREEPVEARPNDAKGNKLHSESKTNGFLVDNRYSSKGNPEDRLRERLTIKNDNIKNIDLSVEKFFRSSKLSRIARGLKDDILEMAAKAQLLWSVPGIALKPSMYCALDTVKRFLCNRNEDRCLPDKLATIEPENDIQATGVPCQAFMGFLVQEISRSDFHGNYTLREAIRKYCSRLYYCPEIRILDANSQCSSNFLDCPTVYSSILTQDETDSNNFIS